MQLSEACNCLRDACLHPCTGDYDRDDTVARPCGEVPRTPGGGGSLLLSPRQRETGQQELSERAQRLRHPHGQRVRLLTPLDTSLWGCHSGGSSLSGLHWMLPLANGFTSQGSHQASWSRLKMIQTNVPRSADHAPVQRPASECRSSPKGRGKLCPLNKWTTVCKHQHADRKCSRKEIQDKKWLLCSRQL